MISGIHDEQQPAADDGCGDVGMLVVTGDVHCTANEFRVAVSETRHRRRRTTRSVIAEKQQRGLKKKRGDEQKGYIE